jgi:ABC-type uncharacterized transport system permease subunit
MIIDLLTTAIIINVLSAAIRIATPLLLAAMGELITEHSGIMNLGLEGTMLTSAFIGFLVTEQTGSMGLGILMASIAGILVSLILGFFSITLKVDQTITGLAINLLASGLTLFWFRSAYLQLSTNDTPLIEVLPDVNFPLLKEIPYIGEVLFSHNFLTYLAFLIIPVIWFFLYRTKMGLQIRCLGEDPQVADMAGINVGGLRYLAVVIGGVLVGLSGAFISVGSVERFFPEMTAGRGWLAFVIVIAGNWKPARILFVTLFFAFLDAFQLQVQGVGVKIPYQILLGLPYFFAIVVMIVGRARSRAPEALGEAYHRE